jgi:hypothetical protein
MWQSEPVDASSDSHQAAKHDKQSGNRACVCMSEWVDLHIQGLSTRAATHPGAALRGKDTKSGVPGYRRPRAARPTKSCDEHNKQHFPVSKQHPSLQHLQKHLLAALLSSASQLHTPIDSKAVRWIPKHITNDMPGLAYRRAICIIV